MTNATPLQDTVPAWLDEPRAYAGVRTRRIFAFLLDYTFVLILCIPIWFLIGIIGVLTLGLGWLLYGVLLPLVAIPYVAFTLGGASQATPGMRLLGIRLERLDGGRVDPALGVMHSVLFWAGNVLTSGVIVVVALFTARKQLVQDLLLGTVVVRNSR